MKATYYLSLLILIFPVILKAQSNGTIVGSVRDLHSKAPLTFVNIILRNQTGGTVIKHEVTDHKGNYTIQDVPVGNYYLQATYIGYDEYKTPAIMIDSTHKIVKIDLLLDDSKSTLKEVNINSKKALLTNTIDKKVYNVGQDLMAKSASASEILQNVPSVQMDLDGNVSLRNSSVTILINGKISPLMGKNAAAVLQQLPAGSIEKIEVITNPSSKYKPDGTGGIINIILKKNMMQGINGSLTANVGNSERYNAGSSLNYNIGKINFYGSLSIKQDDRTRTTANDRIQTNPETGVIANYNDLANSTQRPFSTMAGLGFDYTIDSKTSFGLSGNYFIRKLDREERTHKLVNSSIINQDYDRIRAAFEKQHSIEAALYFDHGFEKDGHKIRLDFNINHAPGFEENRYTNVFRIPEISDQRDINILREISGTKQLTLAYENPLSEHSKLEAGYDGQFNSNDVDYYGEVYNTELQSFVEDPQRTNHFIYDENIHALYGTFTYDIKKIEVMLGTRGEFSDINSRLITNNTTLPNHYFKLYPTLHLTYKVQENKSLQLNYSRRVRRPEAEDLNPFVEYLDPTNIRVGNPYLLPEIIHSAEAGYSWTKDAISIIPGIYYRYTLNRFTSVTQPLSDSVLITRQQNLANDRAFGADIVLSLNLKDKLTVNFTPNIFYNQIDASNLGYSTNKSTISWTANLNANYAFNALTALQVNSIYKAAQLTPQGRYLPSFVMNLGARREILKKKAALYITASDIFKSQRQEADLQGPNLIQHVKRTNNSRIFYLGFNYNFGITRKKKDLQFDNTF